MSKTNPAQQASHHANRQYCTNFWRQMRWCEFNREFDALSKKDAARNRHRGHVQDKKQVAMEYNSIIAIATFDVAHWKQKNKYDPTKSQCTQFPRLNMTKHVTFLSLRLMIHKYSKSPRPLSDIEE